MLLPARKSPRAAEHVLHAPRLEVAEKLFKTRGPDASVFGIASSRLLEAAMRLQQIHGSSHAPVGKKYRMLLDVAQCADPVGPARVSGRAVDKCTSPPRGSKFQSADPGLLSDRKSGLSSPRPLLRAMRRVSSRNAACGCFDGPLEYQAIGCIREQTPDHDAGVIAVPKNHLTERAIEMLLQSFGRLHLPGSVILLVNEQPQLVAQIQLGSDRQPRHEADGIETHRLDAEQLASEHVGVERDRLPDRINVERPRTSRKTAGR